MENHIPSQLPAWSQCPCYKSGEPGEAALAGTRQHAALEKILKHGLVDYSQLEPDEIVNVEWAAKEIIDWTGGKGESEIKMQFIDDNFNVLFDGTADYIFKNHLFDYKSGEPHNYDLQMYAYAMMMQQRGGFSEIIVHILYGRVESDVKFTVKPDDVKQKVFDVLAQHQAAHREPRPCDYCRWCGLAAICPALNNLASWVVAGREDYKLENYHASQIVKPTEMAKALRMARFLKGWCESVEFHAREMAIKRGEEIPGFSVSHRAGRRFISDCVQAGLLSGLEPQDFLKLCSVTIDKLEKQFGKKEAVGLFASVILRTADSVFLTETKQKQEEEW